jgi:hypothetical protein
MPATMPTHSSQYRIEKLRRPLNVVLVDGSTIEGDVFLQSATRLHRRPEEPSDMLNDDEPFFALMRDGVAILVAKASVARAVTSLTPQEDDVYAPGIPVEVTLTDGSTCTGSIFPETRAGRPRLLDFLNTYRDRFLPIVDARQVFLVNTATIAHVREVA